MANFSVFVDANEKYSAKDVENVFPQKQRIAILHSWEVVEVSSKPIKEINPCVRIFENRFFVHWDKENNRLFAWDLKKDPNGTKFIFEPFDTNFKFGKQQVSQMSGYSSNRGKYPIKNYWIRYCCPKK